MGYHVTLWKMHWINFLPNKLFLFGAQSLQAPPTFKHFCLGEEFSFPSNLQK
jgi:hypothetical protein